MPNKNYRRTNIAEWWRAAGLRQRYPADLPTVMTVLRDGAGYDVDLERIQQLAIDGVYRPPDWFQPADVIRLAVLLEERHCRRPAMQEAATEQAQETFD